MIINKVTHGFVVQGFNTETQAYKYQLFHAGDVDYEDKNGNSIDPDGMQDQDGTEPYLPFDMFQPEFETKMDSCREQIQEDLLSLLDGMDDATQTAACQIVVDNFAELSKHIKMDA